MGGNHLGVHGRQPFGFQARFGKRATPQEASPEALPGVYALGKGHGVGRARGERRGLAKIESSVELLNYGFIPAMAIDKIGCDQLLVQARPAWRRRTGTKSRLRVLRSAVQ